MHGDDDGLELESLLLKYSFTSFQSECSLLPLWYCCQNSLVGLWQEQGEEEAQEDVDDEEKETLEAVE